MGWGSSSTEGRSRNYLLVRVAICFSAPLLCIILSACHPQAPDTTRPYYAGPTLPLDELIARVNENNSRVSTLWSSISSFQAWFTDSDGHQHYVDGSGGSVLYQWPDSLRVITKNEFTDLFDLGSDGARFWVWEKPDHLFWWGTYANLGKPGSQEIPIRPDLVLEVLGIRPINTNLLQLPAPVMRFDGDEDAYMVVWHTRGIDRWVAQKEVWFDRPTLHPRLIRLFDYDGRVVLQARLVKYVPVEPNDKTIPQTQWPMMASSFQLFFPENKTKMNFELSQQCLSRYGRPSPVSFQMPAPAALRKSGVKVTQIDGNENAN
jgi:hypothetical protein